jgi:hypothetical protein
MTQRTHTIARDVGIDGSQKTLTIALYPTDEVWTTDNTCDHHTALAQRLAHLPIQRVLWESSGGYEKQAGLPVGVVPAQRARYFAKRMRGEPTALTRGCWRILPAATPCSPLRRVRLCRRNSRRCGRVGSRWCKSGSAKRSVGRPCRLRQYGRRWRGCLPSSTTRLPRLRRVWKR